MMDLQKKLDEWQNRSRHEELAGERMLSHKLASRLSVLSRYRSTAALMRSKIYQGLRSEINRLVFGYEFGTYAPKAPIKPFYRIVSWDLHHGIRFNGILEVLKTHPILSNADLLLLPSVDLGLARSGNRNIARSLAIELEMNYVFAGTYLSLAPPGADGVGNQIGLEGNAILSRHPLFHPRIVTLPNGQDPMRSLDKRHGCQKALIVDALIAGQKMSAVCAHLDVLSNARQRAAQMTLILEALQSEESAYPAIIGGAFNTSTYNAASTVGLLSGLLNKMARGVDYIMEEHHTYPERHFDARLFAVLKKAGFAFEALNELGKGTFHYSSDELQSSPLLKQVVPGWLAPVLKKVLRGHGDKISLKLDWFTANEKILPSAHPHAEKPKVITHLYDNTGPVSAHDAIVLDFEIVPP